MNIKLKIYITVFLFIFITLSQLLPNVLVASNNLTDLIAIKTIQLFQVTTFAETQKVDKDKANILIMFDDGWATQFTIGFKEMKKRNMVGTIGVITDFVDQPSYLNQAALYNMYSKGWDLINHTKSHKNLSEVDYEENINQIEIAKNWLKKRGFVRGIDAIIYPYGDFGEDTQLVMDENNIISGRTTLSDLNDKNELSLYSVNAFVILYNDNVSYVTSLIDEAIEDDKTLILVFHKLDGRSKYSYDKDKYVEILNYLDEKRNEVNVITYSQWLESIAE